MKILFLTDKEYETLTEELGSLHAYHWNDKNIHANDCGSKILNTIEINGRATTIHDDSAYKLWMENEFVSSDSEIDLAVNCCSTFNIWEPDGSPNSRILELAYEVYREMEP